MAAEHPKKYIPATAHSTPAEIVKAFRELCLDPEELDKAANYMYDTLLDDAVVGVFLEIHQLMKSGTLEALDGVPENDTEVSYRMVDAPNYDIFGVSTTKKPQDCVCPNCERPVAASRFAPHLEKCMGMGRISSRIASRRLATKEVASSSSASSSLYQQSSSMPSDDDGEDVEWTAEKRRKKTSQNSRSGGSKKSSK